MSGDSSPTRAWTAPTFGVPYGALCQAILFQPALGLPQWKRGSFHICISHPSERRSSSSALRSQEGCQGPRAGGELPTPAAQPGELSGEARTAQASTGKNCPALPKRRRAHQGSRGAHLQTGQGVTTLAPRRKTAASNSHIYRVHTVKSERTYTFFGLSLQVLHSLRHRILQNCELSWRGG